MSAVAYSQRMVGRSLGDHVVLGAVIVLAILWVVPVLWVLILSFKANSELMLSTGRAFRFPYTLEELRGHHRHVGCVSLVPQ